MAESGTLGTTTRRMIDGSQRPPPLDSAAILGGELTLTSPAGSLTFVSSPFPDQNYYINPESLTSPPGLESRPSFSQLLAGAMDSPAAIPFESLHKEASFRDYSTEKSSDFGFSHQLFSGSGSGSVFSPAFFSTSAPANVTLQTAFAQSRPTATEHTVSQRVPATDAFQYQPHAHKRTHNPYFVNADKPADDGYNWRKYGQKPVKGCEFPRSYYKCTSTGCPVKKKVERSSDGQITQIIYKGQHNHGKPQNRRGRDTGSFSGFGVGASMDPYQAAGSRESDNSEERRNGWYIGDDDGDDHEGDDDDEEDGDGRASKIRKIEGYSGVSTCHRTVTEPKIIVQTRSEVDLLDDGYRWRKYGQKVVKGNPHPRSYYKCTTVGCTVRKHIERAATDSKAVMTTYEGKHNHDLPTARASSNAQKVKPSTDSVSLLNDIGFGNSGRGSVILQLKEEKITVR